MGEKNDPSNEPFLRARAGIGPFELAGRTCKLVVQLLHALAHLRRFGIPSPHGRNISLLKRAQKLHRLCNSLLEHLNVRTIVEGNIPERGMLVTNHVSFLDIMFLGALRPMIFVSKSEVAQWPLVGPIATGAGTLYVERSRRADVSRVNQALSRALGEGVLVTLFPEGTSSDGSSVLPFQPSLLQPAVDAQIAVSPAHLEYTDPDGGRADDLAYFGDRALGPCLLALVKRKETIATLRCGHSIPPGIGRKQLTSELHSQIVELSKRR